jgi:hypothetical protein
LIDQRGRERILDVGTPDMGGSLPHAVRTLLDTEGRHDLAAPQAGWTIRQARDDIERLLGRSIS